MRWRTSVIWPAGVGFVLLACGDRGDESICKREAAVAEQAITNGSLSESYLGLGAEDVSAIVSIQPLDPNLGELCSGVLIDQGWVLTAGHCLAILDPIIRIVASSGVTVDAGVAQSSLHPVLDIALLKLAATDNLPTYQPMTLVTRFDISTLLDERVELAGFGLTEQGTWGALKFGVERVTEISDQLIRVDGRHRSGACSGDSGGPLLVRSATGDAAVVGILSTGSASCTEQDTYTRTDIMTDWVGSQVSYTQTPSPSSCGNISKEGKCLFGTAFRCIDGSLATQTCVGGRICGWNASVAGYGCVMAGDDPCEGVGSSGKCIDGTAIQCVAGTLVRSDCRTCGNCLYSTTTGNPECVISAQ